MNLNLVYRNNLGKGGLSDKLNLFDKLEKSNKELPCSLLFWINLEFSIFNTFHDLFKYLVS